MPRQPVARVGLVALALAALSWAAPLAQSQQDGQSPQIFIVMDVSGTMGIHVLPENVPEDLLEMQAQLDAILNDQLVLGPEEEWTEIEGRPEVLEAKAVVDTSLAALDALLAAEGYDSLDAVIQRLEVILLEGGCGYEDAWYVAESPSRADVDSRLDEVCSGAADDELRARVHAEVGYVEHPDYPALVNAYVEDITAFENLLESLGYYNLFELQENALENLGYFRVSDDYEARAEELGYPTRLALAKIAAGTLLDLSRLDDRASGRSTRVGLVTFSDTPYLLQTLTADLNTLDAIIETLVPIDFTNISGGLQTALDEFETQGQPNQPSLIILLSDGKANRGLNRDEMLSRLAPSAANEGIRICTVGFGNDEEDVDVELLTGLADVTGGQYLFARTGEELVNFFVACRQGLVADVVQQFTGRLSSGETAQAGSFQVTDDTGQLSVTLNYLQGTQSVSLVDANGQAVAEGYPGLTLDSDTNLQLVTVNDPSAGEWQVSVTAQDAPPEGSIYNVVVAQSAGAPPAEVPAPVQEEVAPEEDSGLLPGVLEGLPVALPVVIGGCLCLGLAVAGVGVGVVLLRRRGSGG